MRSDPEPLSHRLASHRMQSAGHRRIADCILRNPREVAFWGVEEMASQAQTSLSAVVRLAQKLGYAGFTEMREALVAEAKIRSLGEERLLQAPKDAGGTLVDVARRDIANIEKTLHVVSDRQIQAIVQHLERARHRVVIGHGISWILAQHLGYILTITGLVTVSGNPAEFARQVVNLGPQDLLVAISFPPYSVDTLNVMRHARRQQVPVLLISDRSHTPLSKYAQQTLPVPGESLLFSQSLAGWSVLTHTIGTTIASKDPAGALKRLRDAERIADEQFVDEPKG